MARRFNPGKIFNPSTIKDDRDKLVAPFLFVDGHSQHATSRDFQKESAARPRTRQGLDVVQAAEVGLPFARNGVD